LEWRIPAEVSVSAALRQAVGGHPLVAEILARRGITDPVEASAFLDPQRYTPTPPAALPDLEIAAQRLIEAIRRGEHILVWGDFDVDGQTATALLVDALRDLGAQVAYHIPHRLTHGHGVQPEVLQGYIAQGFGVILTCDTGISAHEAAEVARSVGATLLITDHHALPPTLPDAPAVVNPQRLPPGHPLSDLPGVGVAYKLAQQLYALAGRADDDLRLLDLVALGIVADVAVQRGDTRYLLQLGLDALRYPQRVGLQELMRAAQVDPTNLSADTIGYQVGPRLNALGRLDHAGLAVELLTTDRPVLAQQIAAQLEVLNNRRKQIEDQIYASAQEQIAKDPALLNFEALVLAGERWHPGVIGIVAARLVEQYHRPVLLFAAPPGEPARGSARSVPGVDIEAALKANADLLISYGGHPGAAGCVINPDLLPQFRRRLSNTVAEIWDRSITPGYTVDAEWPLSALSMELANDLNRLAPFGEGNPPVLLMAHTLRITANAVFGIGNKHRRVTVEDEQGVSHTLVWWRGSEQVLPEGVIDLLYIPRINDYKGRRSLQLEWVASRPTPGIAVEIAPRFEIVDLRSAVDALAALGTNGYHVWAEGLAPAELPFDAARLVSRYEVHPTRALTIWTAPPGPQELEQMIERTQARTFYVVAQHIPQHTPQGFLQRLAGLVKYALSAYGGEISVLRLAAATAQREVTVRYGLDWLAAKGVVTLEWLDGDRARLTAGGTPDSQALEPLQDAIRALLAETAAYRAYFQRADLRMFFGA